MLGSEEFQGKQQGKVNHIVRWIAWSDYKALNRIQVVSTRKLSRVRMEAYAQYEFTATSSDELSFPKGATLKVSRPSVA